MDDTTVLFARITSAYLLVTGLGFLVSTEFYERMVRDSARSDPVLLNLSGAVHFLAGLVIVLRHWRWGGAVEVLVTLIGVSAVLKGGGLIVAPQLLLQAPPMGPGRIRLAGVCFMVVGAYLGYASTLALR